MAVARSWRRPGSVRWPSEDRSWRRRRSARPPAAARPTSSPPWAGCNSRASRHPPTSTRSVGNSSPATRPREPRDRAWPCPSAWPSRCRREWSDAACSSPASSRCTSASPWERAARSSSSPARPARASPPSPQRRRGGRRERPCCTGAATSIAASPTCPLWKHSATIWQKPPARSSPPSPRPTGPTWSRSCPSSTATDATDATDAMSRSGADRFGTRVPANPSAIGSTRRSWHSSSWLEPRSPSCS